jgi:hypothetical protein
VLDFKYYNADEAPNKFGNIVGRVYVNDSKPSLDNASNAITHIGLEQNGDVQAFASIFKNTAFADALVLGNYQCIDEMAIAQLFFREIEKYTKLRGAKILVGPMNGDTWHSYRFSTLEKPRFFLEANHKNYYLDQWKNAGFCTLAQYQTNREEIQTHLDLPDYQSYFDGKGITVRHFNMQESDAELCLLHGFCSELFKNNLFFSPISESDFVAMYQTILPLLNPNLIYYFMDNEQMVGLLFAVENRFNPNEIIVKTIARHPAEKYKGLAHMFSALFHVDLIEMGIESMLHAYFQVDNNSARISTNYGGEMYQQHVLLSKTIA